MSFARKGPDCDIYVIEAIPGHGKRFQCIACDLDPLNRAFFHCSTAEEMYDHVIEHVNAGHKINDRILPRLLDYDEDD